MADFAPNYTARYKLIYTAAGLQHSCGLRFPASMAQTAVVAAAVQTLNEIFAACAGRLFTDFTLVDAEYSAANSTFFVPVGVDDLVVAGTVNAGINPMDEIVSTTWSGRSIGGHKGKFVLFGIHWAVTEAAFDDFVVTATEQAFIGTVANSLRDNSVVMNDNLDAAFWRQRATIKPSDAWIDARRP
jgi:hypothetical protein